MPAGAWSGRSSAGGSGPNVEPVLPIGQEWELSRRLLAVLELGQIEL